MDSSAIQFIPLAVNLWPFSSEFPPSQPRHHQDPPWNPSPKRPRDRGDDVSRRNIWVQQPRCAVDAKPGQARPGSLGSFIWIFVWVCVRARSDVGMIRAIKWIVKPPPAIHLLVSGASCKRFVLNGERSSGSCLLGRCWTPWWPPPEWGRWS